MYQAYDFTYAGMPASMYGMFVCDVDNNKHSDNPFGNKANIVEERIAGRVRPLHYGVRYNDEPLTFTLIFGSENVMDRYQLQEISQWLTGYQDYQWLSIDQPDLENIQFRCLIESLTPISVGWLPVAFEAKVVCDCPYGYGYEFSQKYTVNCGDTIRFYNDGTSRELFKPVVKIELESERTSFSMTNNSTGETMIFSNLPTGGLSITIDNENGLISDSNNEYDLYNCFNFVFLELEPGDNVLCFEDCETETETEAEPEAETEAVTKLGTVTISGRFLYNVGA